MVIGYGQRAYQRHEPVYSDDAGMLMEEFPSMHPRALTALRGMRREPTCIAGAPLPWYIVVAYPLPDQPPNQQGQRSCDNAKAAQEDRCSALTGPCRVSPHLARARAPSGRPRP